MDLLQLHKLKLWLLPPNAKGLAAARAEVIRRTAGSGAVILMDDDAKAFALTTRESSGRLVGKKLSFNEVVKRLMIAHQEVPTAMLVGIQHWYHHAAPRSPNDARWRDAHCRRRYREACAVGRGAVRRSIGRPLEEDRQQR